MSPERVPASDARLPTTAGLVLLVALAACHDSRADSIVNIWLSNADAGPAAPVIYALPGATSEIQVWARPADDYRLTAFSLNLVAEPAGTLTFTNIDVLNPSIQGTIGVRRHQLVFDTEEGLEIFESDRIERFSGVSFYSMVGDLSAGQGIGPTCGGDGACFTGSGSPSWHIATAWFDAGMSLGSTNLFLEIGTQGLWQSPPGADPPDEPDETSALFGAPGDAINEWDVDSMFEPLPDSDIDHRNAHQGAADAVIVVASADFDEDGDVDGADCLSWQRGLGAGSTHAEGDANGDSQVNASDLAAWRFQFGATGVVAPVGSAVPEPAGVVAVAALACLFRVSRRQRARRPG